MRQRRRGHRGPDPQYLTCKGPSVCWTFAIIPTQSRVRCTIFVNIIDCVVSAVVEQVYSSTFKFCLLKIQEICPMKRFIFTSKCTKMRLVVDPLGELTALLRPPSWIKGEGRGVEKGKGEGKGREREGGGGKREGKTERGGPSPNVKYVEANGLQE